MKYKFNNNTKLRIALLLDKKTNKIVKKYNNNINKNIEHDISFNKALPHITLISGVLKNRTDFDLVCKIISKTIKSKITKNLDIEFTEFYKSEDRNWLFLKLKNNQIINELIKCLKEELHGYLDISPARQMHVTIAKSSKLNEKEEIINKFCIPKAFFAQSICIGLRGEHGTLVNAIKKFKI